MKLNVLALGLACGLIWGLGLFIITWWIIMFDGQQPGDTLVLGRIYRGYELTTRGSLFGLLWGLGDGFIGGVIFAWLYNMLAGRVGQGAAAN